MKTTQGTSRPADDPAGAWGKVFAGAAGCCLALALLKFGNPIVIFEKIASPIEPLQLLFDPWPLSWGYLLFAFLVALGAGLYQRPPGIPAWVLWLPAVWIAIQFATVLTSVDRGLSLRTVLHFASVACAFYLGATVLGRLPDQKLFWAPILIAFGMVLADGLYQHFYGLEETRRYFYAYQASHYPNGAPPELLQKIASNRIYATLFYPNTFAGTILLLTPPLLERISRVHATRAAKNTIILLALAACGGCLAWSGSKAGWLIALTMLAFYLSRFPMSQKIRVIGVLSLCIVGVAAFSWRYAGYLKKGATSASARLDYWRAGFEAFKERPLTGYGPGTFMISYKKFKRPEAEMTRLAHNDYLQQATDSGLFAFLAFTTFVWGSLVLLYRKSLRNSAMLAVWMGVVGLSIQSAFEFHTYVPALAWPQFLLLGWLWAWGGREGQRPSTKAVASA